MDEKITDENISAIPPADRAKALKAILTGGLAVGVLDCLAATVNAGRRGVTFSQVWQYVASGLLGRDSYNYGWKSVLLGLALHFFIALAVVAVYFAASRFLPVLIGRAVLCGALYGIAVYFVMGYVVSPLSATSPAPFSFSAMLTGILIHIFCVGLPAALIVRRFSGN